MEIRSAMTELAIVNQHILLHTKEFINLTARLLVLRCGKPI
jgi:hypothetical protein